MKSKICLLFVLLVFTACHHDVDGDSADAAPVATDTFVGPTDEEIMANYLVEVNAYNEDAQWRSWMIQRKDWWSSGYISGRRSHDIHVYVRYESKPAYSPSWSSEAEHFAALKRLAELQFPGWDFTFLEYYEGVEADMKGYDIVAVLGHSGFSYASGRTIYLVYETIFAHEFGHTLGLHHHYCNDGGGDNCPEAHPPGEGVCIMDRNSVSFGPTENRFLLLTTGERRDTEIGTALNNIHHRYPRNYLTEPSWNECGMDQ